MNQTVNQLDIFQLQEIERQKSLPIKKVIEVDEYTFDKKIPNHDEMFLYKSPVRKMSGNLIGYTDYLKDDENRYIVYHGSLDWSGISITNKSSDKIK